MSAHRIDSLTIAAAGTDSSEVANPGGARWVRIYAPSGLVEATTITSAPTAGGTHATEQSGGVDIGPSGAGKVCTIDPAPEVLKIHLASGAAADRTFSVVWGS